MIVVEAPGLLTTVQDGGRTGYRAAGLPRAGAMDRLAFALANLLCGNPPDLAALELTLVGGSLRFERAGYAALAGADLEARLGAEPVAPWTAFPVAAGDVLALGAARGGCRAYLAVRGGIDVPAVMGSRSTYLRARLGGLEGRALRGGDVLPVRAVAGARSGRRALPPELLPPFAPEGRVRVLLGPQDDLFAPEEVAAFLAGAYAVTNRNDRMGYQLEGPRLRHLRGADIVSDGVVPGSVQVPGSGQPIVLMADAQTTGGYAKIATVIGPDLRLVAQARRGDTLRFVLCSEPEALEALRAERRVIEAAARALGGGGRSGRSGGRARA